MVTVPISFQYNLENQGVPEKGKDIRQNKRDEEQKMNELERNTAAPNALKENSIDENQKKKDKKSESELIHNWEKRALGQSSEQKVFDSLQRRFFKEPCLLVNGFKESDLVKVIKENIEEEKKRLCKQNQKKKRTHHDYDVAQSVFQFYRLTNRHYCDIVEQVSKLIDPIKEDRFCEENSLELLDLLRGTKPGHNVLTESNKNNYMNGIEILIKKKLRNGAVYTKNQLRDHIVEHLLRLTYPNSEFDLLLFLKVCSTSQHLS